MAQTLRTPVRIGYLSPTSPPDINIANFQRGLQALGYSEGKSFVLEVRYAHRNSARFPDLMKELLDAGIDIFIGAGPASRVAPLAGRSVPALFAFSGDPVDAGLVRSLARPDGNATGLALLHLDIAAKRVDLLHEAAPQVRRIGLLSNPNHPGEKSELRVTNEVAGLRGLAISYHQVVNDAGYESAFAAIVADKCDALMCFPEALSIFNRMAMADFALRQRLPSMFGWRAFAEAGGMMSYGPSLAEAYARLAYFVHRVITGTRPIDLPIEQPTRIELVVNLKTAKTLGVGMPQSILARSDDVIE